jgi:hypothetical protein
LVGGSSNLTVGGNAVISGDLTVQGNTTTVNTQDVLVEDQNIVLGNVANPSDATANTGGITLLGTTNKTFEWINSTDSWTSSEHIDINVSKSLKHGGTVIVNANRQLLNLQGITSTGDIDFASGNFTVAQTTGNTVIGGTLNVQGTLTLTGLSAQTGTFAQQVSSGGNFSVGGTAMTVNAASGNIVTQGSLTVTGASILNSSVTVTGNITASGDVAVNGGDLTTTTTGAFSIADSNATTINIGTSDATVINLGSANSTVTITDDLEVTNNLVVTSSGTASFQGQTTVGSVFTATPTGTRQVVIGQLGNTATLTAYGNVTFGVSTASTGTFTGNVDIGTSLTVGTTLAVTNGITGETLTSTVSSGTAPLTVASDTLVSNLNADKLDGNQGSYYTNADNLDAGTVPDARLLTTGVTAATYGSATAVGQFTVDVKGRLTGAQAVDIQIAQSQVTDLTTDLAAKADSSALATVATSGAYSDLSGTPSLATVATTGAYTDLTGLPTLGTAAATASTDYATAAQGAKADTALQSETIDLTTLKATVAASTDFADFQSRIAAL